MSGRFPLRIILSRRGRELGACERLGEFPSKAVACVCPSSTARGVRPAWAPCVDGVKHVGPSMTSQKNATLNPFWDFSRVLLPCCTHDTHIATDSGLNAYLLFLAVHLKLEALFAQLKRHHHFGDADNVIFSGGSSGGIGCHDNSDRAPSMLPLRLLPCHSTGVLSGKS